MKRSKGYGETDYEELFSEEEFMRRFRVWRTMKKHFTSLLIHLASLLWLIWIMGIIIFSLRKLRNCSEREWLFYD